jgi:hypothetical protein
MSQAAAPPPPSILEYVQPRMPTGYYPGPAPTRPMDDKEAQMQKTIQTIILAVIIVLLIFIVYNVYRVTQAFSPQVLSRRLANRGWTVYLLKDCVFCNRQMTLLGGAFRQFVLCDKGKVISGYTLNPPLDCKTISGYPLWYNVRTGERKVGYQDAASLKHMAR